MECLRILRLLLYKNLLVRKTQWKMSLFGEIIVPVGLIACIWAVRNLTAEKPRIINQDIYYENKTMKDMVEQNFGHTAVIYFTPKNDFTEDLMGRVKKCLNFNPNFTDLLGYDTEEQLIYGYQTHNSSNNNINVAVVFNSNISSSSKHLEYKIRTNQLRQNELYTLISFSTMYDYYVNNNPFASSQLCIDTNFMQMKAPKPLTFSQSQIFVQSLPSPPRTIQGFSDSVFRQIFSAIMVIAFMIPLFIETAKASNEKFLGVNVLMSMNGVSNGLNLFSWLLSGYFFLAIFCVLPIFLLFLFSFNDALPYVNFGNPFIIWLVFNINVMHLLAYGIHVSAYFNKSLHVIFGILILYTCSQVLQLYGFKEDTYQLAPYLGILFPNLLLFRAMEELNYYETIAEGVNWSNLFTVGDQDYKFGGSMGMVLILSIIGIIFQFSLAIYVYEINPGKYGVKKHPLYFLQRKSKDDEDHIAEGVDYDDTNGKPFEQVPAGLYLPGIQIRNLKKSYNISLFNKSKVHALRGVSIDFYKGQITSLLGHNGAGKTTMMSILTGMMGATSGQVLVNSKNIKHHSREILNDMGLCTQENMVFPNLTVTQQLKFFAMLKNRKQTKAEIDQNIEIFLKKFMLYDKRNSIPSELSGGQKRRVCLGMALIGAPSILILDEPTSGLDPESRRVIWDVILKMRTHKTILISTHDMEEADILGDRIAILHTGQLRSYGTSMFLKKLLGKGNIEVTLAIEPGCDIEKVRFQLDCESKIINEDGSKVVLSVPNSPDLPDALDNVERKKEELGISGLSVSLISMEQVFLKVTQDDEDSTKMRQPFTKPEIKLTDMQLYMQSVRGLFLKKISYTKRNFSVIGIMLFLVLMALVCISLILKQSDAVNTQKLLPLELDVYSEPHTYFKSDDNDFGNIYRRLTESFNGKANEATEEASVSKALINFAKKNLDFYDNHMIAAAEFNQTKNGLVVNALYSEKATFSLPISLNMLTNTLIKNALGDDYSISVTGQQLPSISYSSDLSLVNGFTTAVVLAFLFFPTVAMFVLHPLRENSTSIKQLQRMTGVSCWTYWGTMFICDLIILLFIIAVIISGFVSMDYILELKLYETKEILISLLLLVIFAFNILPVIYLFSFIKAGTSSVTRLLTYIPVGIVTLEIIMYAVNASLNYYESVRILRPIQKRIFLLFPYVSFFHGQVSFYMTAQKNARCKKLSNSFYDFMCPKDSNFPTSEDCCRLGCYDGKCSRYLDYFGNFKADISLEESLVYMVVTPILYITLLVILEYQLIQMWRAKMTKHEEVESRTDEQVRQEEYSIAQQIVALENSQLSTVISQASGKVENGHSTYAKDPKDKAFLVHQLRKRYGKLQAVKNVSFSVNQRECFGLLGVNGAGKSTTFRMMSGGEIPDFGVMYIDDKSYAKNRKYFLSQMGYCPQHDAIIRSLNAYDHLRLFGRLRGIPEDRIESEVETWIDRLNLKACAAQPSGTYSGGNKRRLNIAIALIGIPKLVLLDEPTTGVDPGARRSLWNVIQSCQTTGQAVVLTSHSMEECEALCNRLAIMVGGRLVCIGPSQELKQRFGAGYDIQIKMNPEKARDQISGIKDDMVQSLACELVDEHSGYLMYHVTPNETTWRKMYNAMNVMKSKYDCIDDFSVLSSTLEQLFLLFARAANNEPNPNGSSSKTE